MVRNDELCRTVSNLAPAELAAFLAVVEFGGFRAAARAVGSSPSALSHSVAGLEARLKVQLFIRTTRNVSLTEAGERFAEALQPALGQIGRAFDALEGYSDRPAGTIRINGSTGAAEQILEPMLIEFLRQHPDMRLDIRSDDALVDIASGGFDCGLRLMELVPEDMVAIPVGPEQQHIVVAAPLYLQDTPDLSSPADLHAHECIQLRLSGAARYRWEFERRGEAFSVATEGRLVFDSTRLILGAARAGFGVGYITRSLAARDLETGSLVQLLADWTPPYPGLAIYYPRNRHLSAGMRAFIDFVRTSPRRAG